MLFPASEVRRNRSIGCRVSNWCGIAKPSCRLCGSAKPATLRSQMVLAFHKWRTCMTKLKLLPAALIATAMIATPAMARKNHVTSRHLVEDANARITSGARYSDERHCHLARFCRETPGFMLACVSSPIKLGTTDDRCRVSPSVLTRFLSRFHELPRWTARGRNDLRRSLSTSEGSGESGGFSSAR